MATNKILIGLGTVGAVAVVAFASSAAVLADEGNGKTSLVEKLATRFNLNQDEVKAVFEEHKTERQEARLDKFVEEGTITEEQKILLQEKKAEMKESMPDYSTMTKEEIMQLKQEWKEEMKAWAEENGINLEELRPDKGQKGRFGPNKDI